MENQSSLSIEDEALIRKFIALQTEEQGGPIIQVPDYSATSTDWTKCLLARFITDRMVLETQFTQTMSKAWMVSKGIATKQVTKN